MGTKSTKKHAFKINFNQHWNQIFCDFPQNIKLTIWWQKDMEGSHQEKRLSTSFTLLAMTFNNQNHSTNGRGWKFFKVKKTCFFHTWGVGVEFHTLFFGTLPNQIKLLVLRIIMHGQRNVRHEMVLIELQVGHVRITIWNCV